MIMANEPDLGNCVRERRQAFGWSQDELARRSGLSRAGVSAIETRRLVPSTAAALALALALDCRVEDLFSLPGSGRPSSAEAWAWPVPSASWRYWRAEVGGRVLRYPVETSPLGFPRHDGVSGAEEPRDSGAVGTNNLPSRTLVMASCDPAVGLLQEELARDSGVRLLVFQRSSRQALDLLRRGLVHAAGVHLSSTKEGGSNGGVAGEMLGPEGRFELLRVADWEEGVAVSPSAGVDSVGGAVRGRLRWIGREEGSGARQCLDEILVDQGVESLPRMLPPAANHRGVAEAIRSGWADAGVCLRLASEEAGLDFLAVRREAYDLCISSDAIEDPRLRALIRVVRSPSFRRVVDELPGYSSSSSGELRRIGADAESSDRGENSEAASRSSPS